MKIALIIENSQAAKSETVHAALSAVAEPLGHQVFHYGMYAAEDKASLTYVMNGVLTAILLNSGAADFVVTGCGTGMGSMLAWSLIRPTPSCSARSMTETPSPCPMPRGSVGRRS
jgi:ribose 5-phosphate isomerase RpiB